MYRTRVGKNIKINFYLLASFLLCSCKSLGPTKSPLVGIGLTMRFGHDKTDQLLDMLKGKYDHVVPIQNLKSTNKWVVNKLFSGPQPIKLKVNRQVTELNYDFRNIRFCETPTKASQKKNQNSSRPTFASLYNNSSIEIKKALVSAYYGCLTSQESGGYWSERGRFKTYKNRKTGNRVTKDKFLDGLYVDRRECGSGTCGFSQIDSRQSEGSQKYCVATFNKWGIHKWGSADKISTSSNGPANDPDQEYNVACGSYLTMSYWINSQLRSKNGCARVIPSELGTNDCEHGPIIHQQAGFVGCVQRISDPAFLTLVARSMGYSISSKDIEILEDYAEMGDHSKNQKRM